MTKEEAKIKKLEKENLALQEKVSKPKFRHIEARISCCPQSANKNSLKVWDMNDADNKFEVLAGTSWRTVSKKLEKFLIEYS